MNVVYTNNLFIENQVQEEETMRKIFDVIWGCDKFEQVTADSFLNVKLRYIF